MDVTTTPPPVAVPTVSPEPGAAPPRLPVRRPGQHLGRDPRRDVGRVGEEMAADYLRRTGHEILARNWRSPDPNLPGELDIVARSAAVLVVCEVKTRTTPLYGPPSDAVTPEKASRLRALAAVWLREQRYRAGRAAIPVRSLRVDVLGIVRTRDGAVLLQHLPGAC